MTASRTLIDDAVNSGQLIARIDAQDAQFIEPLREFLYSSGCMVVVNQQTQYPATYWICVGDSEYVKSFVEGNKVRATRRLTIVYEGDISEQFARHHNIKIVLVDPVPINEQIATDIFKFFFTGRSQIRDTRKGLGLKPKVSVIPKIQQREETRGLEVAEDENRVSGLMKQIFEQKGSSTNEASKRKSFSLGVGIKRAIVGFFALVILLGVGYIGSIAIAGACLYGSSVSLGNGNAKSAGLFLRCAGSQTKGAQSFLTAVSSLTEVAGLGGFVRDQELLLSLFEDATNAQITVLHILETGKSVVVGLLSSESGGAAPVGLADVLSLRSDVTQAAQHLALIQAQLDSLLLSRRFPFSFGLIQKTGHDGLEKIVSIRREVEYVQRLLALLPEVGGFKKKQTYLVLLQNSMEIRPTGGFIGSVAILSLTDGKLSSLEVQDVYTADGQLKGHVDPPLPIRNILGQEHWYLRDSNWDPDFSLSGPQAAWFYEKEMGVQVDGVVALSLPFITKLLEVTGPLELSDFNERISANNFFVKSLLYTQTDFFPGSTQKKDFLGSLTTALLMRLTTDRSVSAPKFLQAVATSLDARDIQFYFTDTNVQKIISQWDWAGKAMLPDCVRLVQSEHCIGDGVALIQANLAVNKVNYFMKEEAASRITIATNGDITHDLALTLKNESSEQVHDGGGPYVSYLRFYYPQDSEFVSAAVDGIPLPLFDIKQRTSTQSAVLVEKTPTAVIVGFPVTIPSHAQKQITLSTKRIDRGTFTPNGAYVFTLRKQAGVSTLPWHVSVDYPSSWGATSDSSLVKPGSFEYNTDLARDSSVHILFTPTL